jgi:uncharacterized protein (DUF58 family)
MTKIADHLDPKDLSSIANLQVLARLVVEGFTSGLHRSPHKGFSVEFKQHRQYVPGDDLRHLDWKVFGKTDRFYIREYEEETNLRATILLDRSGSMAYAGNGTSKYQYAMHVAAALSYLMLQQADSVGLVTFDTEIQRYIPPRGRPSHLSTLLEEMLAEQTGGETALSAVFHDLVPKIHRRGLLIILSDCFDDLTDLLGALAHFRHARHEVLIFQILDRDELEFPFRQWSRFDSLEVADMKLMLDPAVLRDQYIRKMHEFSEALKQGCARHHVDLVPMVTDEPYAAALGRYLALRRRRG